jgi:hypothetical protein
VVLQPGGRRHLDGLLQLHLPARLVGLQVGHADVGHGVDQRLGISQAAGQLDRSGPPGHRRLRPVGDHVQLRPVAVGHGELPAGRDRLQHGDGPGGGRLRLPALSCPPVQPRQPAQALTRPLGIAGGLPDPQRRPAGGQRLLPEPRQVGLHREALQQLRPRHRFEPVGVDQRRPVVLGGLPVRPDRCRLPGRLGRVTQRRLGITGLPGVVDQPGDVDRPTRGASVSACRTLRFSSRRAGADREASAARRSSSWRNPTASSPTTSSPTETAASTVAGTGRSPSSTSHISARVGITATSRTTSCASRGNPARRARTRSCTVAGTPGSPAASTSVTSSGFPPVSPCTPAAGRPTRRASSRPPPPTAAAAVRGAPCPGGQAGHGPPERMLGAQLVVAVGDQQQRRDPLQPPTDEDQQVQGRLVGPVRVLHHHDRPPLRPLLQLVEKRREHRLARPACGQHLGQPAAGLAGDVVQRTQRPGRQQRITDSQQAPGICLVALCELPDEGRLADPRLTRHQHGLPACGRDPSQQPVQLAHHVRALQEHRRGWGATATSLAHGSTISQASGRCEASPAPIIDGVFRHQDSNGGGGLVSR